MTIYFAYGSNLNIDGMASRCPRAIPICKLMLRDSRLVFRGVADCVFERGSVCPGGLWKITPECEEALDRYEGIGSGMYRKEYLALSGFEGETELMLYTMNSTGIMPPSQGYYAVIQQGYKDFGISLKHLRAALSASWENKAPSKIERYRYRRDGKLPRARERQEHVQ